MIRLFLWLKDFFKGAPLGGLRSKDWPRIRREHLIRNPFCAVCGGTKTLEIHHISAYHTSPERELDLSNLITLCESKKRGVICHLFFGHFGSYRDKINSSVREDAKIWRAKLNGRQQL